MLGALVPVDPTRLELGAVDELEGEAVALALVEWLLAETNAQYQQHRRNEHAFHATATGLTAQLFEVLGVATIVPELDLWATFFDDEPAPAPEIRDRHAVRCLPQRSPDKSAASASPTASVGRLSPHGRRRNGESRVRSRRRKPEGSSSSSSRSSNSINLGKPSVAMVAMPRIIELPAPTTAETEDPETRAWRLQCLKEMAGDPKQKAQVAKWPTVSRPSSVLEPRVSLEVDVTESNPLLLKHELHDAASAHAVKMKSSLNTFSGITTPPVPTTTAPPPPQHPDSTCGDSSDSTISAGAGVKAARRDSHASSMAPSTTMTTARRANPSLQLDDGLSRSRGGAVPHHLHGHHSHHHHQLHHGHGHHAPLGETPRSNPWKFEHEPIPRFVADVMSTSTAAIPTAIAMAPGVALHQDEVEIRGPERRDPSQTMSRKRFELHQRLTADYMLHEGFDPTSPTGGSSPSPSVGGSPTTPGSPSVHHHHPHHHYHHHHHHQLSPRPYQEVPADPIPVPTLSPISKNALIIPRTHLAASASTSSLRIRNPPVLRRQDPHSQTTGRLRTLSDFPDTPTTTPPQQQLTLPHARPRPRTALAALPQAEPITTTYLREFPKPRAGVIRMNSKLSSAARGQLATVAVTNPTNGASTNALQSSGSQRWAWIT